MKPITRTCAGIYNETTNRSFKLPIVQISARADNFPAKTFLLQLLIIFLHLSIPHLRDILVSILVDFTVDLASKTHQWTHKSHNNAKCLRDNRVNK